MDRCGRCLLVLSKFLCCRDDKNIIPGQGQKLGYGVVLHEYYRVEVEGMGGGTIREGGGELGGGKKF